MDYLRLQQEHERNIKSRAFDIAKRLGTTRGFVEYYFNVLGRFKTQKAAFDLCNELYFMLFGEYRYSDFRSFRKSQNKYVKLCLN